jgi:cell division septation protein DedD
VPRSGEVSLEEKLQPVVPESEQRSGSRDAASRSATSPATAPAQKASGSTPGQESTAGSVSSQPQEPVTEKPAAKPLDSGGATPSRSASQSATGTETPAVAKPATQAPAPAALQPSPDGAWAVQVGAFGNEANAEKLVGQLQKSGLKATVRTTDGAGGKLIHKVWIGYFDSREKAATFARQHRKQLGEAIPVHR